MRVFWTISLPLLAILFSLPSSAISEPLGSINIPATKHNRLLDFGTAVETMPSAIAMTIEMVKQCDSSPYRVSRPLSLPERNLLKRQNTEWIEASKDADQFVFDEPHSLPDLTTVYLGSEQYNSHYLDSLSRHHRNIEALIIRQRAPLSRGSLQKLWLFNNLEYLELDCPLEPTNSVLFVAQRLKQLHLSGICQLTELPHLVDLRIRGCVLPESFFHSLHAPRLASIDLDKMDVSKGSLHALTRFKRLRTLAISASTIDKSELPNLQQLPFVDVAVRN